MSKWHAMSSRRPSRPCGVELFFGNAPLEMKIADHRDCRRDLGFWDGETFREMNTGHSLFERWRPPEWLPTHWRELPATPETR